MADVIDQKGWTYRAMVSRMDKGIGKIVDAIEASGEKDNTIVVFMSNNGGCPGMEPAAQGQQVPRVRGRRQGKLRRMVGERKCKRRQENRRAEHL